MSQYYKKISSKNNVFDLKLREVWEYRDLIFLFTKRTFILYYKQTILGPLWIFLSPLITSVFYMIVFGNIAKISTGGIPQLLFYLSGNAIWTFFSSCVSENSNTFRNNAAVFGKVYFPRLTVSIANVLSASINFFIQMILVVVLLIWYAINGVVTPNWLSLIVIPLVIIWLGILGMGCGIIISSLTTKYRDLAILVTFGISLWMYATPVIYPLSTIEDGWIKFIVKINPVTPPVELFRFFLLGHGTIDIVSIVASLLVTAVIAVLGVVVFNRVDKNFMDTV